MGNCISNSPNYPASGCGNNSSSTTPGVVTSHGYTVDLSGDWTYREVYKKISSDLDPYFKTVGQKYKVDWRLIAAWCYCESGFNPNAESSIGALGIWQFIPTTWTAMAPKEYKDISNRTNVEASFQAFDKNFNINLNAAKNAATFNDKIALAIQAHHDGSVGNGSKTWANRVEVNKGSEARAYVYKIVNRYKEYCK